MELSEFFIPALTFFLACVAVYYTGASWPESNFVGGWPLAGSIFNALISGICFTYVYAFLVSLVSFVPAGIHSFLVHYSSVPFAVISFCMVITLLIQMRAQRFSSTLRADPYSRSAVAFAESAGVYAESDSLGEVFGDLVESVGQIIADVADSEHSYIIVLVLGALFFFVFLVGLGFLTTWLGIRSVAGRSRRSRVCA